MRARVAGWLHRAGAIGSYVELRARLPRAPRLPIITYHHICDPDPRSPFDTLTADATPAQFRRQLELIARHFVPITMSELIAGVCDGAALPANPVMVTFDDGYRSCHDIALPILREVGVPATFFIATSYVEHRRLYWWEVLSVLLARTRRSQCTLSYPYALTIEPRHPKTNDRLAAIVKDTPDLDLPRMLSDLARALDVEWSPVLERPLADQLIMTWDHVRTLAASGMGIESHSRYHRVLQTLDRALLDDELAGSRTDLETQLGRPVRAIAYPVGRRVIDHPHIVEAIERAGYQVGFSNASGVNRLAAGPLDRFNMRRVAADLSLSDGMFLAQLALPGFAYIHSVHRAG